MDSSVRSLIDSLVTTGLCTPRDIRASGRRVRRLTQGLPEFRSVWIDALRSRDLITTYQADVLESHDADALVVGPCVLLSQLGSGKHGRTFVGRHRETNQISVLKLVTLVDDQASDILARFQQITSAGKSISHPSIVVPTTVRMADGTAVLVSRRIDGSTVRDLLLRRGRFPATVVAAIGRQLINGLVDAEVRGLLHGDIRPQNCRLSRDGRAVLVDAGIRQAIQPGFSISDDLDPRDCDGIAPERLPQSRTVNARSELYAVGCLLWELLSGRPPFPIADVNAKLAAHQSRCIPDVRELAPDTPDRIAESLAAMTSADASRRPVSFREAAVLWGRETRADKRAIQRFAASFRTSQPPAPAASRRRVARWLVGASAGTVMLAALVAISVPSTAERWMQLALRSGTGAATSLGPDAISGDANPGSNGVLSQTAMRLPNPDAGGRVLLQQAGPWLAGDISVAGPLLIEGATGVNPRIKLPPSGIRVTAQSVTFRNIHFLQDESGNSVREFPRNAIQLQCQSLTVDTCTFVGPVRTLRKDANSARDAFFEWTPDDPLDRSSGNLVFQNSAFRGSGDLIRLSDTPARIDMLNVLKSGDGSLLSFTQSSGSARRIRIRIHDVTLRDATCCLLVSQSSDSPDFGPIEVNAANCVFDLQHDNASLIAIASDQSVLPRIEFRVQDGSESCLLRTGVTDIRCHNPATGTLRRVDRDRIQVDGIVAADFDFVGLAGNDPRQSVVAEFRHAPRSSDRNPGIDASRMIAKGEG